MPQRKGHWKSESPKKSRNVFLLEEQQKMLEFFYKKIEKIKDQSVYPGGLELWKGMLKDPKFRIDHCLESVQSHFTRQIKKHLKESDFGLPLPKILRIYQYQRVKLNPELADKIKNKCKENKINLTLTKENVVKKFSCDGDTDHDGYNDHDSESKSDDDDLNESFNADANMEAEESAGEENDEEEENNENIADNLPGPSKEPVFRVPLTRRRQVVPVDRLSDTYDSQFNITAELQKTCKQARIRGLNLQVTGPSLSKKVVLPAESRLAKARQKPSVASNPDLGSSSSPQRSPNDSNENDLDNAVSMNEEGIPSHSSPDHLNEFSPEPNISINIPSVSDRTKVVRQYALSEIKQAVPGREKMFLSVEARIFTSSVSEEDYWTKIEEIINKVGTISKWRPDESVSRKGLNIKVNGCLHRLRNNEHALICHLADVSNDEELTEISAEFRVERLEMHLKELLVWEDSIIRPLVSEFLLREKDIVSFSNNNKVLYKDTLEECFGMLVNQLASEHP